MIGMKRDRSAGARRGGAARRRAGRRAIRGRVPCRQERHADHRLRRRAAAMTCGAASSRRHIGKHLPGNPTVVPQNMPGAGSYVAASHIYGAAPKDGTVFAIIARDAALGPAEQRAGRALRRHETVLARQPDPGAQRLHRQRHRQGEDRERASRQGTDPGRHRAGHRHALLSEGAERPARLQVQARFGLSLVGRRVPGDGARRGRRHLREPRQHQPAQARVDSEQDRQRAAAGRRRVASRARRCAERADARAQRRGKAGAGVSLRRAGHRPAVRGAARPAAGAAEDAARCLQRDHEGPGVHRRRQAQQVRPRAGGRRASRGADRQDLRDAEASSIGSAT